MIILDRFTYLSGYDADPGIEVSDPYLDSGATAGRALSGPQPDWA
jgi:hypothetical protein